MLRKHDSMELCYLVRRLREENFELVGEVNKLRKLNEALAERVAGQSELLSKKAEIKRE